MLSINGATGTFEFMLTLKNILSGIQCGEWLEMTESRVGGPLHDPVGGKEEMAPMTVVSGGEVWYILELDPIGLVHGWCGGVEAKRRDNRESKRGKTLGEMKISVSSVLNYFLVEDFPDPQSWLELFISCPQINLQFSLATFQTFLICHYLFKIFSPIDLRRRTHLSCLTLFLQCFARCLA